MHRIDFVYKSNFGDTSAYEIGSWSPFCLAGWFFFHWKILVADDTVAFALIFCVYGCTLVVQGYRGAQAGQRSVWKWLFACMFECWWPYPPPRLVSPPIKLNSCDSWKRKIESPHRNISLLTQKYLLKNISDWTTNEIKYFFLINLCGRKDYLCGEVNGAVSRHVIRKKNVFWLFSYVRMLFL